MKGEISKLYKIGTVRVPKILKYCLQGIIWWMKSKSDKSEDILNHYPIFIIFKVTKVFKPPVKN